MTNAQREIVNGLNEIATPDLLDATFIIRLYYSKPNYELSDKQNEHLLLLLKKYKDQLNGLWEMYGGEFQDQ